MTLACLSVHYCLGDLQVMMFAMSASVSVALQSVNLFAPCPLHCMFAQDFVSACLDVFGGSYYLPVEIKTSCLLVHTCLFHKPLVIQVLSCLHKTQRHPSSLHTCLHVPMCLFMYFCSHKSILVLHKVWSVFNSPQVCSGHSICLLM